MKMGLRLVLGRMSWSWQKKLWKTKLRCIKIWLKNKHSPQNLFNIIQTLTLQKSVPQQIHEEILPVQLTICALLFFIFFLVGHRLTLRSPGWAKHLLQRNLSLLPRYAFSKLVTTKSPQSVRENNNNNKQNTEVNSLIANILLQYCSEKLGHGWTC